MDAASNRTPKKRGRPPKGWKRRFVEELARCGVQSHAARAVGVSPSTAHRVRKSDPKFDAACEAAIEESVGVLEVEARRRAVDGVEKPVYQGGKKVGDVREYSDTLLIFLLKANKPEKYRESSSKDQTHMLWLDMANRIRKFDIPSVDDRPDPDPDDPENPPSHARNGATT